MKNIDNLCMNCFEELTSGSVCEECGFDNDTPEEIIYLQMKTVLADRYVIGRMVAHESDAAVYMGYDTQLDKVITIREFLPKGIAVRLEGNLDVHIRERYRDSFDKLKASFLNLWTTLVKMKNLSAVIPTYDVFELNGTAYAVSEYMESISLREFLLRNPDGNIDWDTARIMFMPILTTLEALHSNGIIHGAICPDNLLLCRDGKVRLKGFCISEANTMSSALEFNVNDGYTAIEQYDNNHKMGPATDIYAFSACIFRALVGQNPPDAKSRETNDRLMIPNTIAEKIPTYVIRALGGGLQIYPEKRTQDINTFREQLSAAPTVVAAAAPVKNSKAVPEKDPVEEEEHYKGYPGYDNQKSNSKSKIVIIVLVVLIVIACVAGVLVAKNGGLGGEETTSSTAALAKYTVPNFTSAGYTQSDIENNGAWNKQFKLTFDAQYSVDVDEGIVFKQSINAGEEVDEGTEIILTISKGVQTAEVPDVGGLTLEEATEKLKEAGFEVSSVEVYNDGGYTPGTVKANYGMAPSAGSVCAVGDEVILQVYGEEVVTTEPSTESDSE
ncbi:MAG: PASTA domain-containing protein [Eubacteriales bacterium]|nr:PASTA domain-containing protein [Eubacteriales bacterium]